MGIAAPIIGSVAGALISKGGSKNTSTTVQSADPWSGVQPALHTLYDSAVQNFQGGGPQYYPGQTIAPQSPVTNAAQQGVYGRATQGNPLLGQAQDQASSTLNGDYFNANPATQGLYDIAGRDFLSSTPGMGGLFDTAQGNNLNSNPYLDDMFGQASSAVGRQFRNNVMPGVASMYEGAGRYGSNAMSEGMGQAEQGYGNVLSDLATKIYGGNYASERGLQQQAQGQLGQFGLAGQGQQINALDSLGGQFGRERLLQSQAMGGAPGLANADYFDLGQLTNLGASQDLYNQSLLGADKERYDFGQNAPNNQLSFLQSILSGAPGGQSTGTTTQNVPGNPLMGALGGFQLGNALSGGMFGAQPQQQYQGFTGTSLAPFFYGNGTSGD